MKHIIEIWESGSRGCWSCDCGCGGSVSADGDVEVAAEKHLGPGDAAAEATQIQQDLAASQADLTRALEERDGLADTLALRTGQLNASRRFVAEARREGDLLKAELASARTELERLREYGAISARVIRERNADRRAVWRALGVHMLAPPPDAAETIRGLIAELEQLRARINELESKETP